MFWTEIGNIVRIERAGMDGSDRRVLVNSSLGWPGTLTVDMVSNRIYWTDERLQAIGSATLDGSDLQVRDDLLFDWSHIVLNQSCAFRSCRLKRRPTLSLWPYSTRSYTGQTPRDEWCTRLTRFLEKTSRFF